MKRILVLTVLLLLSSSVIYVTEAQVLFPYNGTTELFDNYNKRNVISRITEDYSSDTFYEFDVIKKKRKMVLVDVCAPDFDNPEGYNSDSVLIIPCKYSCQAWVRISDTKIYGIIREGGVYLFYSKPNYQAHQIVFDIHGTNDYFKVIDIYGLWLKVEIVCEGKKYKLWMSPESQCSSITNECI